MPATVGPDTDETGRATLAPAGGGGTGLVPDYRLRLTEATAGCGAGWHAHRAAPGDSDLFGWNARLTDRLPAAGTTGSSSLRWGSGAGGCRAAGADAGTTLGVTSRSSA
jgi:hypothetical protein